MSRCPTSASSSHPARKLRSYIRGGDGGVVGDDCGDGSVVVVVVGGGGGDVGT